MLRTSLSLPLLLLCLSAAHADPLRLDAEPEPQASREGRAARASLQTTAPAGLRESRGWLSRVHLDKKAGLAVRRELCLGERDVVLGLKGPLMKHKRLGLAFEVRF